MDDNVYHVTCSLEQISECHKLQWKNCKGWAVNDKPAKYSTTSIRHQNALPFTKRDLYWPLTCTKFLIIIDQQNCHSLSIKLYDTNDFYAITRQWWQFTFLQLYVGISVHLDRLNAKRSLFMMEFGYCKNSLTSHTYIASCFENFPHFGTL